MTTTEFQDIKDKIENAKQNKARAEGAIQKIEEQWEKEFGVKNLKQAEAKLSELQEAVESDETKLSDLEKELFEMADWDAL